MSGSGIDLDTALLDPAAVFLQPADVVAAEGLSTEQKVEILRRWAYDARELSVAQEEGMRGDDPTALIERVMAALEALGAGGVPPAPPTKQRGS
jgi:hypothetical protein